MASSFHCVNTLSADGYWKTVALPSRLSTSVTNEHPIAVSESPLRMSSDLAALRRLSMSTLFLKTMD